MAIILYLLNLIEVLFQCLARMRRIVPPLCLFDNSRDRLVLDDDADVDRVVHLAEDAALVCVCHINVLQQLEPERL